VELVLLMCLARTPKCERVYVRIYDDSVRVELPTPCQRRAQVEAMAWAIWRPRWHAVRALCRPVGGRREDRV
jgi:hypothetical protein